MVLIRSISSADAPIFAIFALGVGQPELRFPRFDAHIGLPVADFADGMFDALEALEPFADGGGVFVELRPHFGRLRGLDFSVHDKRSRRPVEITTFRSLQNERPVGKRLLDNLKIADPVLVGLGQLEILGPQLAVPDQTLRLLDLLPGAFGQVLEDTFFGPIVIDALYFAQVCLAVEGSQLHERPRPKRAQALNDDEAHQADDHDDGDDERPAGQPDKRFAACQQRIGANLHS